MNGDGRDELVIHREDQFFIDSNQDGGRPDTIINLFLKPSDILLPGVAGKALTQDKILRKRSFCLETCRHHVRFRRAFSR